ncbi:DUF3772 domain-containing protein [Rhodobacteraceae bacterium WD3A24]|nr:DUF3772 domain-containing protein [Rhodobacteraceae bacterium WD3A24]
MVARALRALVILACLAVLPPALAPWAGAPVGSVAQAQVSPAPGAPAQGLSEAEYAQWETLARRAEAAVAEPDTTTLSLEQLRGRISDWRARFLAAQDVNQARIETLRSQIDALGPPPGEGESEAEDIAQRRQELNAQLDELRAPQLAAEEAFRRAEGLVSQIDRIIGERQADALLQLWPSPVNPANWPAGLDALAGAASALWEELDSALASPTRRDELGDRLPAILAYLAAGLVLLARGRHWMAVLGQRLRARARTARVERLLELAMSLGQAALPFAGLLALIAALRATGMVGLTGNALVGALPLAGLALFAGYWLGGRIFPADEAARPVLHIDPEHRREGRLHATLLGLVVAIDMVRQALLSPAAQSDAANSVLVFPLVLVAGALLFRVGQLMRRHPAAVRAENQGDESAAGFTDRLIGMGGRAATIVGLFGPVLAAVGYVAAAQAIVFPAVISLGLIALLMTVQRISAEIYGVIMRAPDEAEDALVPVLIGFALALLSAPVFALIWGVRDAQLLELWQRFRGGFAIGETRIAPSDFLLFAVVFAVGYTITRILQGALRSSVLPKTRMDKGGQNALVSGVGYIGIFIAALLAINSAGIDLSSLAIVAGALSVGIGFGLQNIVSNFVSGIILLVERPVSEGDWIEVGTTMGIVKAISVRSTVIETFDRTDVIVPNADLISNSVTNWTHHNLTGRLIVKVGVAYGTDTRKIERILTDIAEAHPMVSLKPEPYVLFRGFGGDALEFEIRVILRDVNFILKVHSDINHEIARRFAEEGVEIPFAQRDLWLRNPETLWSGQAGDRGPRPPGAEVATAREARGALTAEDMAELSSGDSDTDSGGDR